MIVAVTGASGFVGRWLVAELSAAGQQIAPTPAPRADVRDPDAIRAWLRAVRPDAVVHLAAIAAPRAAAADPDLALSVAVDGTRNVIAGLAAAARGAGAPRPLLLLASSSEVYGPPTALPLVETMPVAPATPYARAKADAETVALEEGPRRGIRVAVTRSFNHTGPGQSTEYAIPAFARRIVDARAAGRTTFSVGTLDVRRDLGDVRDVVRAYRLLLELEPADEPIIVNVGSGRSVLLRDVVDTLVELAGGGLEPIVDPAFVRTGEPPEIRAGIGRIRDLVGWEPRIPLRTTLADVLAGAAAAG